MSDENFDDDSSMNSANNTNNNTEDSTNCEVQNSTDDIDEGADLLEEKMLNIELEETNLMKTKKTKLKSKFNNYFDTPIDSLITFLPYLFWQNHLKEIN